MFLLLDPSKGTWWLIDSEKREGKMHCRPVAVGSDIGPAPTLVGLVAGLLPNLESGLYFLLN